MRMLFLFIAMLATVSADVSKVANVRYKKSPATLAKRQMLDLYYDATKLGEERPVVVWVHGGAWRTGDKEELAKQKASWLVQQGFVFVAVNYRLYPEVNYEKQCRDIAASIRWVRDNADFYGGDVDRIVVMGHAAGAHLSTLTVSDPRYLKELKVPRSKIKAAVAIDSGALNIPLHLTVAGVQSHELFLKMFSHSPTAQKAASPISYFKMGKKMPKYLVLAVQSRVSSPLVAQSFANAVREAGGVCKTKNVAGKSQSSINRDLGKPGDSASAAIVKFLESYTK